MVPDTAPPPEGMMASRLVYLMAWPPDCFDIERYGLRTAEASGLEVEAFDMSGLLNPHVTRPRLDPADERFVRRLSSYKELDAALRRTAADSAYVDFMLGLADLDGKHERVFRLLRCHDCRLLLVSAGALPLPGLPAGPAAAFIHRLRQVIDPKALWRFLTTRLLVQVRRHSSLYIRPALIFGGRSEKMAMYLRRLRLPSEIVVPIHSLDFDRYLSYRRSHPSPEPLDGTCVFLDDAVTSHPDFAALGFEKPLEADTYFDRLKTFFDGLEAETGLRVVVAAHPRADYASTPNAFGGRPIVSGKTVELVARASLVLTHASTSVSFAVLMDKPLRLIQTPEMAGSVYAAQIPAMAKALGVERFPADDGPWVPGRDWASVPAAVYKDYRFKYLQSPGVEDSTVWEVVAERVKGLK